MRLIAGIVAFRRAGRRSLRDGVPTELTLREWAARERVATEVVTHYLVPLTSSVWSIEPGRALDMPADTTLRFLDNHGLLGGRPPRWRTVEGGSRSYVDAVRRSLLQRGVDIRTGSTIVRIEREMPAGIVSVTDSAGNVEHYDRVTPIRLPFRSSGVLMRSLRTYIDVCRNARDRNTGTAMYGQSPLAVFTA